MIPKTQILKKNLSKIQKGTLKVQFPNKEVLTFGTGTPFAEVVIHNKKAISAMLSEGDIGFGRGYIEGWWECNDIVSLLDIILANIAQIESTIYGNRFYNFVYKVYDFFKKNTLSNSKKNIEYHYDLGNDFYFKWLDETKTYSSALFVGNETLVEAQRAKYQNIIKYLPQNTESILEIGCGWGGFMQEAVNSISNIKIKGLTLSNEQFAFVKAKFAQNQNIQPIIQDYRTEEGEYDAVVSIEMFEAVGREYWEIYIKKVFASINKNGVAVIQTITIDNSVFEKYVHTSDFIRHFIFPGGMLPTKEIFEEVARKCGFEVVAAENFGISYHKTLIEWLKNFDSAKDEVLALGFDEKFIRKWRFYLAYCAASFGFGRTDVFQFVLRKNA
jgi:cyclopropane-fatty-acyl-phospholipid synthase